MSRVLSPVWSGSGGIIIIAIARADIRNGAAAQVCDLNYGKNLHWSSIGCMQSWTERLAAAPDHRQVL
jgi:hypothetical protein